MYIKMTSKAIDRQLDGQTGVSGTMPDQDRQEL